MIKPRQSDNSVRVVSWNIHKGVSGVWPKRSLQIHNIAYALRTMDADLICLQEVRDSNRREALRYAHWPVLDMAHQDMSDHRFEQRGLLHARVDAPNGPLNVLVMHLGLIGASRVRQLEKTRRYIEEKVDEKEGLVIAGDFNCVQLARMWAVQGMRCATLTSTVPTFPSRLPLNQLDHIFSRGLGHLDLQSPRGQIWREMSDHLPLIAELGWK